MREMRRAEEIDLKLVASLIDTDLFDRAIQAKTGIIDQYIDPSGLRQNGVHDRQPIVLS